MMQETRQQILDHLLLTPEATVRQLGEKLGLTPSGIRQHLMVLEQSGLVGTREEGGRVGRRALVYSLTTKGEAAFPTDYSLLSTILLDEMSAQSGPGGVSRVLHDVAVRMASRTSISSVMHPPRNGSSRSAASCGRGTSSPIGSAMVRTSSSTSAHVPTPRSHERTRLSA
jgi:predicted ArsR family transcriptional regulator